MSTRKHVVLIAGKDLSKTGGHASLVKVHALAAAAAGYDPHVFCASPRSTTEAVDYATLHRVAAPLPPAHRGEPVHRRFLVRAVVDHVLATGDPGPQLIHSFGAWGASGAAAARALGARQRPAVTITSAYTTHLHESRVMSQGFRRYSDHRRIKDARVRAAIRLFAGPAELRGYERSDHVLANYASVRDLLSASCKRGLNVRLMPYAAPAAFAAAPAAPPPLPAPLAQLDAPDAPLIACVARHDPRKGLDLLLRALADLRTAAVPFRACLVGPGSLLDDDRRLAASLGLDACVAIPGRVDDVFAYLAHADIFVLPSLEEGSGSIALLEALQAGTAIVATRCDGIPEDVTDGHDALLVEPGDAGQLRAALQALLTDPPLRRRLASAARATYNTRFSAAHFTAALTALYAECLQG